MPKPPSRPPPAGADPTAPTTVRGAAQVVAWGLGSWGAVQLAASVLERRPMAAALIQAGLAEWGTGRVGIAWSDPLAPAPTAVSIARRAGVGAACGAGVAGLAIAALAASGAAAVRPVSPSFGLLGLGLVGAGLAAVRDELLLRGVVLRATRGLLPAWVGLLACGAVAAGARFGVDGALSVAMAADALRGIALGALWVRDRGAWMALAANVAWTWSLDTVVRGGFLDARFAQEPDTLGATLAVLAVAAAASWLWIGRRSASGGLR